MALTNLVRVNASLADLEPSYFSRRSFFVLGDTLNSNKDAIQAANGSWYVWAGAYPVTVAAGTDPALDSRWVCIGTGTREQAEELNCMNYGLLPDNIPGGTATANREHWHTALAAAAVSGKTLYIPDGIYSFDNFLGISLSGVSVRFGKNCVFKLLNDTYKPSNPSVQVGGFLILGYDKELNPATVSNVRLDGPAIDCNMIAGNNGIVGVRCSDVHILNPRVYRTRYTALDGGGKAFHWEGAVQQRIYIRGAYIEDCSMGCVCQAAQDGSRIVRAVHYDGLDMYNVDVPFMLYSQYTGSDTQTPYTMSTHANDVNLFNCGSIRSFASPSAGGIVCGDRGAHLFLDGIRVVNPTGYNGVGAFFRGTMFGVIVRNAQYDGESAIAVHDATPLSWGGASGAAFTSTVDADIKFSGNLDYVFKGTTSNQFGLCNYRINLDVARASLTGICDSNAGTCTNAYAEIINSNTGKSTGRRSLANHWATPDLLANQFRDYEARGTWNPVDSSGAGLSLTLNGPQSYTRTGDICTCILDVTIPVTSDTRPVTIGGLPFLSRGIGRSTGGINITSSGASALQRGQVPAAAQYISLLGSAGSITNSQLSGIRFAGVITYFVAS